MIALAEASQYHVPQLSNPAEDQLTYERPTIEKRTTITGVTGSL